MTSFRTPSSLHQPSGGRRVVITADSLTRCGPSLGYLVIDNVYSLAWLYRRYWRPPIVRSRSEDIIASCSRDSDSRLPYVLVLASARALHLGPQTFILQNHDCMSFLSLVSPTAAIFPSHTGIALMTASSTSSSSRSSHPAPPVLRSPSKICLALFDELAEVAGSGTVV